MKTGVIVSVALALALTTGASPAGPATAGGRDVVASPDVQLVTLRNGMRLLLAPDSSATAVDIAVWYRAGTVHERAGITGISHLFEHMMFRGSAHFGPQEHSRLIQAEGGTANAYTTPDYACYHQTVPAGALELVFRLEADRIGSLKLTPENLEAEKRIVREETRWRAELGAGGRTVQRLYALAYASHPYGWPVTGLEQDLERITLADCQAYFDDHYAPNNATVTVVGAFDAGVALRAAKRWLEPLKRRRVSAELPPPEPAQTAERRAVASLDLPVPLLAAGWRVPGRPEPDDAALGLMLRILVSGPASRLQRALVTGPPQCLSVQGAFDSWRAGGLLYFLAAAQPGADSAAVERALVDEVEKLDREPVSDEELERARRQEDLAVLFGRQTARGRAESLGSAFMLDGDWRAASQRLERLRALTPADLQRAAARVLVPAGRDIVWILPTRGANAQGGR